MTPDPRPPISVQAKAALAAAFRELPAGKRGALVVVADEQGARAHVAARLGDRWQVAFSGGTTYHGAVTGQVAVVGAW